VIKVSGHSTQAVECS